MCRGNLAKEWMGVGMRTKGDEGTYLYRRLSHDPFRDEELQTCFVVAVLASISINRGVEWSGVVAGLKCGSKLDSLIWR